MKILVAGYPRSGTTYANAYFKSKGLDLKHESVGKDGSVSWFHILKEHPLGQDINFNPEFVIHLLRKPLDVISSATTLHDSSLIFLARHSKFNKENSKLLLLMHSYIYWYKMLQNRAHLTIRVEDLKSNIPPLNSRSHKNLTFYDLYKKCPQLACEIESIHQKHYFKKI